MLRCELSHFFNYKLALHVFALSEYMEVMLSKNFQAEYLNKIENEIREHAMYILLALIRLNCSRKRL